MSVDLFEVAALEIAEVFSSRRFFEAAGKNVGIQTVRKQLGSGSRKKLQAVSFQRNLQNKPVGRDKTTLQALVNDLKLFSVPTFFAICANLCE